MRSTLKAGIALVLSACAALAVADARQVPSTSGLILPAEQDQHLATVAIEAARRGPIAAIPLLGAGSQPAGAVYDRYRIAVMVARSKIAAGEAVNEAVILAHPALQSRAVAIVAYPIDCQGRPNRPMDIRAASGMKGPVAPMPVGPAVRGGEAGSILPDLSVPADSLVIAVRNLTLTNDTVTVDYEGPYCGGAAKTATFPLQLSPSRQLMTEFSGVKLPQEFASTSAPATVRFQALVDADGRVRFPSQVQGPPELGRAALQLIGRRAFEPFRINGAAFPIWTMVPVVFTANGERASPAPLAPPSGSNTMSVSSTVTVPAPPPAAPRPPVAPAPPGLLDTQLARIAIEIAQARDPSPIPLDVAGPAVHGVLFDRFLVGAVRARALVAAGAPPPEASPALVQNDAIVVAYPLACGDRTATPIDVQLFTSTGPVQPTAQTGGIVVAALLPGVKVPAGTVARSFASANLQLNLEARLTYDGPACAGDSRTVVLPIQYTRGTALPRMNTHKMPADAQAPSPTTVQLRGMVDLEGRYRFPTIAEGPTELGPAAATIASEWRFQPYRANGTPVPIGVLTSTTFTASGMPEAPLPGANPPPASTATTPMTTSTIGGRPMEMSTPDVPGLQAGNSKCAIADDVKYALTPEGAVGVGGDAFEGPARARQYLNALRGPSGQGLRIVRLGSTMGPDRSTILDMYQVTYAGLTQPMRLFIDQYHTAPLRAPQGMVCAVELK